MGGIDGSMDGRGGLGRALPLRSIIIIRGEDLPPYESRAARREPKESSEGSKGREVPRRVLQRQGGVVGCLTGQTGGESMVEGRRKSNSATRLSRKLAPDAPTIGRKELPK